MADPQQDLDAFLTSIESKLRGPFSSLELAKAVSGSTTTALRGSLSSSAQEYLDRIAQVISKTDKITQMRLLIGLLGLDPSEETDPEVLKILQLSQEAPLHEEWVRIIACLVQGIMFEDDSGKPCLGEEGRNLLEKTCEEIIERVRTLEHETQALEDEEPSRLATADAEPTFAPYRYALLNASLLKRVLPETQSHAHFQVNEQANILSIDAKMEATKAQEEKEHGSKLIGLKNSSRPKATAGSAKSNKQGTTTTPSFPGFRSTQKPSSAATSKSAAARPKTSMFMPKKLSNKQQQRPVTTKALHTRKAGAAQALVGKGRRNPRFMKTSSNNSKTAGPVLASTTTSTTTTTTTTSASSSSLVRGRASSKFGSSKSKMKLIDVAEVQGLTNKERGGGDDQASSKKLQSGKKRKAEAASLIQDNKKSHKIARAKKEQEANGESKEPTTAKTAAVATASSSTAGALASAALSAYQAQVAGAQQQPSTTTTLPASATTTTSAAATAAKQQDWRQMLKQKSNRLSADDRFRVQQFFVDRFNPTPSQPTYKMKLHEERTTDPKTGEPVKETYYLELDYTNFTSKQSKKVKRYN